ncbi:MAG: hypothetical protein EBZ76_12535 [Synechococcaceae bacterium WB9_2_170]|nr:hypothetical protein [Synechococcaceae bacterium WB9_2_170]
MEAAIKVAGVTPVGGSTRARFAKRSMPQPPKKGFCACRSITLTLPTITRVPPQKLVAEFGSVNQVLPPVREVLTLAEAIQAYTLNGAKQLGRAHECGSIEVGKKADLVLLSQNLFKIKPEAIPATKVLATMAGGRLVHDVTFGIGDADLTNLEQLDQGAVGLCPYGDPEDHQHKNGHAH